MLFSDEVRLDATNVCLFGLVRIIELHVDGGISTFIILDEGDRVEKVVFSLVAIRVDNLRQKVFIFLKFFVIRVGFQESVMNADRYFFILI